MVYTGFSEINEERLSYNGVGFWYCEVALTGRCNFKCSYCNRFNSEVDLPSIFSFIDQYKDSLRHIQLTGGEPTLYEDLGTLCKYIKDKNQKIKIGLSSNGSADYVFYDDLSINMFSISLDDYDQTVLKNRGYIRTDKVIENIQQLAKKYYVNVGLVIDRLNISRIEDIIEYILNLGVSDIKLSVSTKDDTLPVFSDKDYSKYPILNYRVNRFRQKKSMRGILNEEHFKCELVKNDISIVGDKHYPCLVYAREKGKAIGILNNSVYADRAAWYNTHQPEKDPICKKYCMDFKCEYNRSFILK